MQHLTFKQLQQELASPIFRTSLKYDQICLVRRNNQLAWLLPLADLPESLLHYLSLAEFRKRIGFHIDRLIEYSRIHGVSPAIGLTDIGSEHICYLALVRRPEVIALPDLNKS